MKIGGGRSLMVTREGLYILRQIGSQDIRNEGVIHEGLNRIFSPMFNDHNTLLKHITELLRSVV